MLMRRLLAVVLVSVAAPALAQVQSRPSDPPIVTAENDPWFARGDPIQFGGNTYIRAGAAVFFDGNRMVRSGSFDGVPLYVDTTLEPYSVVFVPVGRRLMQPYERPRTGELAGTTGSRPPSFPVSALPSGWTPPMAGSAPTGLGTVPVPEESQDVIPVSPRAVRTTDQQTPAAEPRDGSPAPAPSAPPLTPAAIQQAREKIWIEYRGERWIPAGPAIQVENSGLVQSGEYAGFPVFTYAGQPDRIFLPSLGGLAAPYQLKR
jgi:hypothetical protein